MQTVGVFILALSCFEKIVQRFKPATFYFMAVVLLLFSGGFALMQEIGFVNYSYDTPNLIQWSFIIEMIIIIIGILYRYNLIKVENENLFTDLNNQKISSISQTLETLQIEQLRIAEDLHDILGSKMAVLKMKIIAFNGEVAKKDNLINMIDDLVLNTRSIAHNLMPVELHHNAISDIISSYLIKLNNIQSIHFTFIQIGTPISFIKEVELDLYKIMMEIIQNILSHSLATEACIQFFFNTDNFEIFVEDNGVGIPIEKSKGMGIKNIRKRVNNLKGGIYIDSKEGYTNFIITIPIKNEPAK
jgi:signal transduction histidine kinase